MSTEEEDEDQFLELLKKVCKKCTKKTLQTYHQSVKRLYRLVNKGAPGATSSWLKSKELFEKYKKIPVNRRRHLSMGAQKAVQAYKLKDYHKWYNAMLDDQQIYQDSRKKGEKSETEKKLWLKGGVKDIKKASNEVKRRLRHELKEEPNLKTLYRYQFYLVLKLFAELPVRNTFATLKVDGKTGNRIVMPKKGKAQFIFTAFKNADKLGPRTLDLSRASTMALRKFLKYRSGLVKHDYLLSTKRGERLSKSAMGKALHVVTKEILGKSVGSRIFRVLHATENREVIEQAAELSKKMLHSEKRTADYVRKD